MRADELTVLPSHVYLHDVDVAAQDATRGVVFYTLTQQSAGVPQLKRPSSAWVPCWPGDARRPGLLMFSRTPSSEQSAARSIVTDHRSRLATAGE